jgi:hypothetical protein
MAAAQAALDQIELQKRLHIRVNGEVEAYERDPLANAEGRHTREAVRDMYWMPFGRFKGRGFKHIHAECPWYLPYMVKKGRITSPHLLRNVQRFLSKHAR